MENMRKIKHQIIFDYIKEQIYAGKFHVGDRLPTDGQLMLRFSVSRGTIGKAMRDLENAGIVTRRAGCGTYVSHTSLTENTFVAVLIAGLGDTEFFEPICAQIADACHKHNLSLIWGTLDTRDRSQTVAEIEHYCELLKKRGICGLFFVPDEMEFFEEDNPNQYLLNKLKQCGIRVVLLDRSNRPFPERSEFDLIGVDNFHIGYTQAKHLLDCGCKRILYLTRPAFLPTKETRIAGYRYAVKKAGIPFSEDWIMQGNVAEEHFLHAVLAQKPDGIACFHDPIALTLMRGLLEKGVKIPDRIKIIGVDDVRYSQYMPISLTTIRQPCHAIAEAATTMMLERLTDSRLPPRELHLSTELVVRQSTMCATWQNK